MGPTAAGLGALVLAAMGGLALGGVGVAGTALPAGAAPTTTTSPTTTPPTTTSPTTTAPDSAGTGDWTVYHGSAAGTGVAASAPPLDRLHAVWRSPTLDGQLFGEPLVVGTRVVVATENDTVDALSAATGALQWSTHLATPVPSGDLPCGDIAPTVGITGTPVIDPAADEVFVVADELVGGTASHHLVGLDLSTGRVRLDQPVDPSGSVPTALLQRTGLNLDDGSVVFGMGGNYGDCGPYHGWVIAVPESGGAERTYAADGMPGQREGAVWMGGAAPEVDHAGDIWVAVGNGSATSPRGPYDGSDAVIELSAALAPIQSFAPARWAADNASDLDLGSSAPALLADGLVVQAGKSGTGYLLNGAALGGIGGQRTALDGVCSDDVSGGTAVDGTTVYEPCLAGLVALSVGAGGSTLSLAWQSPVGAGPPVEAGGLVWTIGHDGVLYGLSPANGAVAVRQPLGSEANHFPTPAVGAGLLLAPTSDQVLAFAGPAAPTAATTTTGGPPSSRPAAPPAAAAAAGPSAATVVGVAGAVVVAGAAVALGLAWRRRRRPGGP